MISTNNFYNYPLLIKQLLISPLSSNPYQEIIDNHGIALNYKDLNERIYTLSNALNDIGIKKGDTVGVMDWDTPRYLECFFAIPMIGAILHTINIRLSEQQILYTINHAEDDAGNHGHDDDGYEDYDSDDADDAGDVVDAGTSR